MHPTLSLGDYELDVSPYEDTVTRKPWKMNLSKLNMLIPGMQGLDPAGRVAGGEHSWGIRGESSRLPGD